MGITASHASSGHPQQHAALAAAHEQLQPEPPLLSIVQQMRSESFGVAPKDVLVGSEICDWMLSQLWCASRARAVELGQALINAGALRPVGSSADSTFRDAYSFYRFAAAADTPDAPTSDEPTHEFDVAIIGGGIAGLYAAQLASRIGAHVALIEKRRVGGESTWSRGVPFSALAQIARVVHDTRTCASRGVHTGGTARVDMSLVRAAIHRVIHDVYAEQAPPALAKRGVEVLLGAACFTDATTVEVTLMEEDPVTHAISTSARGGRGSITHMASLSATAAGEAAAARGVSPNEMESAIFEPPPPAPSSSPAEPPRSLGSSSGGGLPPAASRSRATSGASRPVVPAPARGRAGSNASGTGSPPSHDTTAVPPLRPSAHPVSIHHTLSGRRRVRVIRAARFILATGTAPRVPTDIEGLSTVQYHTFESIVENTFLPRRLVVIGGSASGCEVAQAYSRLGAEVTIIAPCLLPKEGDAVRDVLRRVFYKERIVHVPGRADKVTKTDHAALASPAMYIPATPSASPPAPASSRIAASPSAGAAGHVDHPQRANTISYAPTHTHAQLGGSKPSSPVLAPPSATMSPPTLSPSLSASPASSNALTPQLSLGAAIGAVATSSHTARSTARGSFTARAADSSSLPAPILVHVGGDTYPADMLFVAVGHVPTFEGLGLRAAGVELSPDGSGVRANAHLQTSAKHIYAAGDIVAGADRAAHYAAFQGHHAARNALMPGSVSGVSDVIPRVTYTDPEVASVGLSYAAAVAKHGADRVRVLHRDNEDVDRARASWDSHGFMSVVVMRDGTIVGATLVNARAGDMISELTLAINSKLKIQDVALTIHPYPTYASALQQLASTFSSDTFVQSTIGRMVSSLYGGGTSTTRPSILSPGGGVGGGSTSTAPFSVFDAPRSSASALERKTSDATPPAAMTREGSSAGTGSVNGVDVTAISAVRPTTSSTVSEGKLE